ncbi:MAG: VWA domain-containing protein, partial [Candidatus Acidiferrales bacterium]
FGVALALVLVPLTLASQESQRTSQIHVATRLVEVGVIVRDKNGPVANLTKDDFTVLDQGKPQKISIFSAAAAASAQQPPRQPPPHNTFSDLPQYGVTAPRSITVVLLDNLNTLYGSAPQSRYEKTPYWVEDLALRNAKSHLIEFIKQLQPQDRVAIYGLSDSLRVLCDFTSNRDQLLAILQNYDTGSITNRAVVEPGSTVMVLGGHTHRAIFGQGDGFENGASGRLAGAANQDRGAQTMAALQAIAAHVANIPGRKNLVWLTANLPFSGAAMARMLSPANIAVYPVDARGLLAQSPTVAAGAWGTADFDDVSGASGKLDNMPAQSSQPIGITTMQKLADETGGQAFTNTNDITGAIRKAVEDSEVTYTLGFYINGDSLDGKFHELKVESKRKGLTIRYPKGYFAFPDTAATKTEDEFRLVSAVQSPIESSSIPLTATVDRVDQPPHSLRVLCTIDAHNLRLVQSGGLRKGSVEVYIVEQDQTGRVVLQSGKTFTLQFPEKQYDALLKSGILFHEFVQPRAGVTTLRVLVEDPSTTELGSVIIPLSQVD